MNEDSSRKANCTIPRWKPSERRTPISWRRSTTERALITPSAANADDQSEAHEALQDVGERVLRRHDVVEVG